MQDSPNFYFLGIGGIGMSALARYCLHQGKSVYGYDKFRNEQCASLEELGAHISYEDSPESLPKAVSSENCNVIYTPAIPKDSLLLLHFQDNGFRLTKRAVYLGHLAQTHRCLAVAGTHGKTTTSALLAHLFANAGLPVNAFLGGVAVNYNSNFLAGEADGLLIAEADEFDRSFLSLKPEGAVITSTDADHLDIYGDASHLLDSFQAFAKSVQEYLYTNERIEIEGTRYGFSEHSPFRAERVRVENHAYYFDLVLNNQLLARDIRSGLPGRHNVENAVAAAALAWSFGLQAQTIKSGIESFKGVKRRFEYHLKNEDLVYIDDYAHHPSEISALLHAVRELYPTKKITGIFQPHLFSRTRDFADGFAESLSALDQLWLMDIYPAREKPIAGVNSGMLLDKVTIAEKARMGREEILQAVSEMKSGVILTIGAGDIDQLVGPIKMRLLNA